MYVLASKPSALALDYIHCDLTQLSELVEQSLALLSSHAILTGAMTVPILELVPTMPVNDKEQ